MDFDDDMSGLQIEDLGEYFLQTDVNDSWKGFTLGYTEEDHLQDVNQEVGSSVPEIAGGAAISRAQYMTSPRLSSISELRKHGNEMERGLSYGLAQKDAISPFPTGLTPASAKPDTAMLNRSVRDTNEFENFNLDQRPKVAALAIVGSTTLMQLGGSIKPAAPKLLSPPCQHILASTDDNMNRKGAVSALSREFDVIAASCEPSGCSTIGSTSALSTSDDGRGFRKKSREKMRRQEVNIKFEELIDLLGLSNRVRKSAILQEAVSTIKSLKRERDELYRDRDRLQQELSKLATCLQYSHLGSVAAVALAQPNQQLSLVNASVQQYNQQHGHQATAISNGIQSVHTHPLNVLCNPGTNCFPLSSAFSNISSQMGSHSSSKSGQVAIAPKLFNTSASDTEMT